MVSGNATEVPFSDDPLVIVNVSVWESIEARRLPTKQDTSRSFRLRAVVREDGQTITACGGYPQATFPRLMRGASGCCIFRSMARRRTPSRFRSSFLCRRAATPAVSLSPESSLDPVA
jgi:hypothetical protein